MRNQGIVAGNGEHAIVERRWALEWSGNGIALSCVTRRSLAGDERVVTTRRPALRVGMLVLAGCGAVASAALASVPDLPDDYRIVVAIPPAKPRPAAVVAVPHRPVAVAPVQQRSRTPAAGFAGRAVDTSPESRAGAMTLDADAIQEWQDRDGASHYLVGGPVADVGQQRCRDFSLLTRSPIAGDSVERMRRCAPKGPSDSPIAPS